MKHDFEVIEVQREMAARPETVWRCWTDPTLKEAWFVTDNTPEWSASTYHGDLSEGGKETASFVHAERGTYTIHSNILLSKAPSRFIYSYRMDSSGPPITASLVTVALEPSARGTALTVTEQINFLDGHDSPETRVPGTEAVIDKMVRAAETIDQNRRT